MNKAFRNLSLIFFLNCGISYGQDLEVCEIKYGSSRLIQQKRSMNALERGIKKQRLRCTKIGEEINKFGEFIKQKPIYACCKKTGLINSSEN